jgi:ribose 5-phosphate isomerase B
MKIILGSDHAGFEAKEWVKALLLDGGHDVRDVGTTGPDSCDYPDFALPVACAVSAGEADRGILICGTGIGMSIAANKVKGVRAALCHNPEVARMSRAHNDANILCMGGRVIDRQTMGEIVREWFTTPFDAGRHLGRLEKIQNIKGCPP